MSRSTHSRDPLVVEADPLSHRLLQRRPLGRLEQLLRRRARSAEDAVWWSKPATVMSAIRCAISSTWTGLHRHGLRVEPGAARLCGNRRATTDQGVRRCRPPSRTSPFRPTAPDRPRRAGPGQPHHPVHRGRRHRRRHHPRDEGRRRRSDREGVRRRALDPLDGGVRRREVDAPLRRRRVAARRDARGAARLLRLDQRPDDDSGRRRYPLAQRRPAPGARPLCLPPPRALLQRRPQPAQGPVEDGHGHLPGEHRGHLRRHRVGGGVRRVPRSDRVPPGRVGRPQDPLPGHLGDRDQACLARRRRASRAAGAPLRGRQRARLGHARPQGQHPEVHRGRLPRLGVRPRRAGVRREAARRRPLDDVREPHEPAPRSSSRT